jgi:hypothetical protein
MDRAERETKRLRTRGNCPSGGDGGRLAPVPARDIDGVIGELGDVLAAERGSALSLFPALYRQVTVAIRARIQAGFFEDGARMNRLDTAFANRYLIALARHRRGEAPTRAWATAFRWAAHRRPIALQHVLLGVSAHINLDLAVAAAELLPGPAIESLAVDFARINTVLGSLLDPAQGAIGEHSPLLWLLDWIGGRSDEAVIGFGLEAARSLAWHNARRLAAAGDEARRRFEDEMDVATAVLGERIASPGVLLAVGLRAIRALESRDVAAIADALAAIEPP